VGVVKNVREKKGYEHYGDPEQIGEGGSGRSWGASGNRDSMESRGRDRRGGRGWRDSVGTSWVLVKSGNR